MPWLFACAEAVGGARRPVLIAGIMCLWLEKGSVSCMAKISWELQRVLRRPPTFTNHVFIPTKGGEGYLLSIDFGIVSKE